MPKNTPEAIIDTPYVTNRRTGSTSTGSGSSTFLGLTDTPSSYAGKGDYLVKVKVTEDGLEFVLGSGGSVDSVNGQTGVVVLDTDDIAEGTNKYYTAERAQDDIGTILVDSSSVDFTYTDATPSITAVVIDEYIQDIVGAMVSGNTETLITVTYQDSDGTIDFEITDAELVALAGLTSAADKGIYFTGSGTAGTYDLTSTARTLLDDTSTSAMRTTLGLAIGTNVQAFDATLTSIAALGTAADKVAYTTGIDTWAETPLTSFGRSLIDDAAASNARTTLGLVIGTDVQAFDATLLSIAALGTAADKMAYTTGVDTWAETALTAAARSILDDTTTGAIRTTLGLADEDIQDIVGAFVADTSSIDVTYNDAGNALSWAIIDEYVQDVVGALFVDSSTIDFTYNDGAGTMTATLVAGSVPNASLANSTITVGSTSIALGATAATVAGLTLTTPTIASFVNATHNHQAAAGGGTLDHGAALTGLGDDDHTQYVLLLGRSGGQTIIGGTASGNSLTLQSSSNATKGKILFGTSGYDEVNNFLAVGANDPASQFEVVSTGTATTRGMLNAQHNSGAQGALFILRKGRNTRASPATIVNGDFGGVLFAQFHDGTNYLNTAAIGFRSNGTVATGSIPTDIIFATGAADNVSLTNEVMRLLSSGVMGLGISAPNANILGIKAGGSNNDAAVGGVLYETTTQGSNTLTGEDDLASYSVPSSTLSVNGQSLWFEAFGTFANNANAKRIRVQFTAGSGTTLVFDVGSGSNFSNQYWHLRGRIVRTGAATQKGSAMLVTGTNGGGPGSAAAYTTTALNQTLSGAVTLKVTGEATATGDVLLESFTVGWDDANT